MPVASLVVALSFEDETSSMVSTEKLVNALKPLFYCF